MHQIKNNNIEKKILRAIVAEIISKKPKDEQELMSINRSVARTFKAPPQAKNKLLTVYQELLHKKKIKLDSRTNQVMKIRATRTLSGVTPVTVLTKPYPCPGKCIYCPLESGMPKSYLSTEPGAMRAVANNFDPFMQVFNRMKALYSNGHTPDKIELLVLGGTWSAYPWHYQQWFIKRCFEAANYFPYLKKGKNIPKSKRSYTLAQAQKINEKASYRIIGITIETRPDWITTKEIKRLRDLGCTRVQLGVQTLDNKILDLIKRGHHIRHIIEATKLLRDHGFKIDYHIMQNLPGASPAKDKKTLERVFADPDFRPDQIKIYPTIVSKYAPLYTWWKNGNYHPYPAKKLFELLMDLKTIVPRYCRINRLVRDFPIQSIDAGNKITNLREFLQQEMKKRNITCRCLRCREARNRASDMTSAKLYIDKYEASGGREFFITWETPGRKTIFGFVRLRLNKPANKMLFPELKNAAIIRELHVYGYVVKHDEKKRGQSRGSHCQAVQHKGLGKQLMIFAENIAKQNGYRTVAVIAGVGVREYYRKKLGYKLKQGYMVKNIQ